MAEPGARTAEAAEDRGWRLRHLPLLLAASAVMGAVAAVVGGVAGGGDAAIGAAAGVAVTAFSYTLTTVVLAWADSRDSQLVLPFGLGLYVAKFTLLGAVMVGVASTGWPGLIPLCLGIAAGVVVWTGVHIWWLTTVHARRTRG
ncbi:hypothetical protein [Micromonospora sp. WMMD812]|uniref:hypothetical protein n=1 Tax=Micromonospora sp. WMMD812 TaxID=3015152 RepID=UPI00248AF277|nr:hypothetical protein [Micromonospora sp. WMMD812]WBB66712.1 hypothetical protein O7603_26790 [Micromonospora sp. WMMD812]